MEGSDVELSETVSRIAALCQTLQTLNKDKAKMSTQLSTVQGLWNSAREGVMEEKMKALQMCELWNQRAEEEEEDVSSVTQWGRAVTSVDIE